MMLRRYIDLFDPCVCIPKAFVNLILCAQELALTGQAPPAGISRVVRLLMYHVTADIVCRYQHQVEDFWRVVELENDVTAEEGSDCMEDD